MSNQAWQIPAAGKLALNDLGPIPTPGPSEVVVQISAVSLNYRDVLVVDHSPDYPLQHRTSSPVQMALALSLRSGPLRIGRKVIVWSFCRVRGSRGMTLATFSSTHAVALEMRMGLSSGTSCVTKDAFSRLLRV